MRIVSSNPGNPGSSSSKQHLHTLTTPEIIDEL